MFTGHSQHMPSTAALAPGTRVHTFPFLAFDEVRTGTVVAEDSPGWFLIAWDDEDGPARYLSAPHNLGVIA